MRERGENRLNREKNQDIGGARGKLVTSELKNTVTKITS